MPELPEVETVVRGLHDQVIGRGIVQATVHWPRTVEPLSSDEFAAQIRGQRIESLTRRGKYIIFELSDGFLLVHLRMTGRLYLSSPQGEQEADRWLRVVFGLDNGLELRFSDARKFGRVRLVSRLNDVVGKLGPEPLSDELTLDAFRRRIAGRRGTMIKPLLLDQRFVAGIGNIYADEILWHARIDPRRRVNTLDDEEVKRLYSAIREVLQAGIDHEGASVNWYRKPDGTRGRQQEHFNAYDREGSPCRRCGTAIVKIRLGQRGTHLCPVCQV